MSVPALPGFAVWFALYLLLAIVGTWWAHRYAIGRALIDQPGERRSHRLPTPRGGGVSIMFAMLVALGWLAIVDIAERPWLIASAVGLMLVAGVGWLDDHRPRSAWFRLATHLVAALVLAAATWQTTSSPMATMVALVAVPVLVNVWNFMDGIDGLAASQAAIAATVYALYSQHPGTTALGWALAAACLGFLPFNFPRARIFLGDVGSGSLGYMLAVLLAWSWTRQDRVSVSSLALLLPLAVFLIDASLTLLGRMVRGKRWWTAHVDHLYQRLSLKLGRHWPVTLLYAVWSMCGCVILLVGRERGYAINIWAAAAWVVTGALAWGGLQAMLGRCITQGRNP